MPGYRSRGSSHHRTLYYFDYFLSFDESSKACLLGLQRDHVCGLLTLSDYTEV